MSDIGKQWGNIPTKKLSSDLPDSFEGAVKSVSLEEAGEGNLRHDRLRVVIDSEEFGETITTYRMPKAWTGKGQADMLKDCLEALKIEAPDLMEGRLFRWERRELAGSVKGNARHYPVELA